ncbi:MAG: peptidoglycan DD-metalloendopeptidase family protein [Deltaproteobacteria bacterium]|nr:peptidoglycan DD-metalloendopeptidase family protein [Deltaproteobacteria bacterium]
MANNKTFTVIIVPERSSKVRRIQIPRARLFQLALGAAVVIGIAMFMVVHYVFIIDQASRNGVLKDENVVLKARLRVMQEEVARIDSNLMRIGQLSAKIRAITELNDPDRNLAIGPVSTPKKTPKVLYAPGERIDDEDEVLDSKLAMRLIDSKIETLSSEVLRQESSIRDLQEHFAEDQMLLASTPSIRPVKSRLLTSSFGTRIDPYTNRRVMHKGVDFAAEHGAAVFAPADGIVVAVGYRGEYGKTVVIDHGYGIQTHYAHLSDYKVKIGDKVQRGHLIAAVGKTGRTTGVHLHYEVRLHGIPQDPEKFILD